MNTNIREKLTKNLAIEAREDGTTRGRFYKLTSHDFESKDAFIEYRNCYCYAMQMLARSVNESDEAKSAIARNKAMAHVNDAYAIIATLCGMDEEEKKRFKADKKLVRAWMSVGVTARIKTDYASGNRTLAGKTWQNLQKLAELDMGDIFNERVRMNDPAYKVSVHGKVADYINKAEENKAAK